MGMRFLYNTAYTPLPSEKNSFELSNFDIHQQLIIAVKDSYYTDIQAKFYYLPPLDANTYLPTVMVEQRAVNIFHILLANGNLSTLEINQMIFLLFSRGYEKYYEKLFSLSIFTLLMSQPELSPLIFYIYNKKIKENKTLTEDRQKEIWILLFTHDRDKYAWLILKSMLTIVTVEIVDFFTFINFWFNDLKKREEIYTQMNKIIAYVEESRFKEHAFDITTLGNLYIADIQFAQNGQKDIEITDVTTNEIATRPRSLSFFNLKPKPSASPKVLSFSAHTNEKSRFLSNLTEKLAVKAGVRRSFGS